MEIDRIESLIKSKIEAGNNIKAARNITKNYVTRKQDMYDNTSELLKPTIDAQKSTENTINEKQDELINQLQINDEVGNIKQNQIIAKLLQNNQKQDEVIKQLKENKETQEDYNYLISEYIKKSEEDEDSSEDEDSFDEFTIDEEEAKKAEEEAKKAKKAEEEAEKIEKKIEKKVDEIKLIELNEEEKSIIKDLGFDPTLTIIPI